VANDRVTTMISLTLRVMAKEDTLNRLCNELGPLTRLKKDKGNTAKSTKVTILRWPTKEALKRSDTM
jgi:maltoporin